jgi:hypothetical protein
MNGLVLKKIFASKTDRNNSLCFSHGSRSPADNPDQVEHVLCSNAFRSSRIVMAKTAPSGAVRPLKLKLKPLRRCTVFDPFRLRPRYAWGTSLEVWLSSRHTLNSNITTCRRAWLRRLTNGRDEESRHHLRPGSDCHSTQANVQCKPAL